MIIWQSVLRTTRAGRIEGHRKVCIQKYGRASARHGASARAQTIARMASERRVATLLAFARAFEVIAMDDAIDLLDFLMGSVKKCGCDLKVAFRE